MTEQHNVELDGAGLVGRARLTCYTCKETCLKQPYMNREQWTKKVAEFCLAHLSEVSEQYQKKLQPPFVVKGEYDR